MQNTLKLAALAALIFIVYQFTQKPSEEDSSGNSNWHLKVDKAFAEAKEKGKPVLVNFTGSDWCPYCIKLEDEVFAKKPFEDWAEENVILLKCDFPRSFQQPDSVKQQNNALAQKYGISGFPTVLLIDSTGNILARSGYLRGGSANWVEELKAQLKN